ncbi:uncharacterized protein At2g29880-like [Ipomoea triloba]|uniref:uncharacterized protein At2g29880-like n=1 Tax=Ipomoea triloba TaxID=35885 RepID=UPI00125E19B2|nr:uncharacterized protein At2g29880-like [Ipomoea triloba]
MPVEYFRDDIIKLMLENVGKPLKFDRATTSVSRGRFVRADVELEVLANDRNHDEANRIIKDKVKSRVEPDEGSNGKSPSSRNAPGTANRQPRFWLPGIALLKMSSDPTSATIGSQSATKQTKRKWTPEEDIILVSCLTEMHNVGKYNSDTGFKTGYLIELERMILEKIPNTTIKAKPHIESRIKTLKKEWGIIHDMVQGKDTSEFGWNEHMHMVYAEDAIWDSYLISHKEATPFRTRSFRFYNELSAIYSKDRATGKDAQIADDVVEEIQVEEQNDIRVDTDNSAFVGLDDFDFMSTQVEPQNDGRKISNSSKRKKSNDEAIEICAESMLNAAKLISNTMPEVGKNLSDGLQYDRDMDMFQKLDRVLQEVEGLTLDEMDLVSLKLTDHPNKVAFFLSLDPDRRLQWIRRFLAGH